MADTTKLQETVDLLDKAMSKLNKIKQYKNNWHKEKMQVISIKKELFAKFTSRKQELKFTASEFVNYLLKTETKYLESEAHNETK
jgi:hypothetical protein